ncbi:MAG: hypothetical protein ACFFDT_11550 [Candidatus Hodarchaeota archaeon]
MSGNLAMLFGWFLCLSLISWIATIGYVLFLYLQKTQSSITRRKESREAHSIFPSSPKTDLNNS